MLRLFVGLELPEALRAEIAALGAGMRPGRPVPAENMHLTLRFIGNIDDHLAEDVDAALEGVRAAAFELVFRGVGCFDTRGRVRAVWAGIEPCPPLMDLQARIDSALIRSGFPAEGRKFKPHVSFGRMNGAPAYKVQPLLERLGGFAAPPLAVESFQLFRSHLGRNGAHYEVLADYPLQQFSN